MNSFDDCDERDELIAQGRAARLHMNRLTRHPDCRDPDHPGCVRCEEDPEENQGEKE